MPPTRWWPGHRSIWAWLISFCAPQQLTDLPQLPLLLQIVTLIFAPLLSKMLKLSPNELFWSLLLPMHKNRPNISHSRDDTNYTSKTIICGLVWKHKTGLVYGAVDSLRSKDILFYRCLDKAVYAQVACFSSIHNSSWHGIPVHSCSPTKG